MSIAYLEQPAQPATDAQVIEPQDRHWFVVINHNGVPRIGLIDDYRHQFGQVYVIFRLMATGETVCMEESNIVCYVTPPSVLPKPVLDYQVNDTVRLTTYEIATLIDVSGDLIVAETQTGDIKLLARWDVLRVIRRDGGAA